LIREVAEEFFPIIDDAVVIAIESKKGVERLGRGSRRMNEYVVSRKIEIHSVRCRCQVESLTVRVNDDRTHTVVAVATAIRRTGTGRGGLGQYSEGDQERREYKQQLVRHQFSPLCHLA
jgi:hypothetical protein